MSKHFNPDSTESFMDAKIIKGNPSGIVNFGNTPHKWAYNIYRLMENNAWFPEECSLGDDTIPYKNLTPERKYAYDMVLAQLSENDSVQAAQLTEDIAKHITSPMVKMALTLQAYQEANHARSYTVTAETVCEDPDKIYELYKTEPALLRKNNAVSKMYEQITQEGANPTNQELLVAFAANQILEELVFPGGFVVMWSFRFKGTSKMISFIQRDETGTHVPLFRNIYRSTVSQEGILPETKEKIIDMIIHMTDEEKIWTKHISKNLLGFTDNAIDMFIEFQANSVCKNLGFDLLYKETDGGPLYNLVKENSMLTEYKLGGITTGDGTK